MVKFTKDGSTATTAAVKLARAYTGRDLVAICERPPFFSYDDWFIRRRRTSTQASRGRSRISHSPFRYNDLSSLERLFAEHPNSIACVFLEPERTEPPRDDFLQAARDLCAGKVRCSSSTR